MDKAKVEGKVSPEAMTVILLDEVSGKLSDMKKHMEWSEQGGRLVPLNLSITALYEHACTPPWYSCTIFNDGPNPVYIDVNRDNNAVNLVTPLNNGENLVVDYEQPKIDFLYFGVVAGQTANVRVFATW